jgi:hypothetical protein
MTLPLTLELTKPVELGNDPDAVYAELYTIAGTAYNPETQLREDPAGVPFMSNMSLINISATVQLSTAVAVLTYDSDKANDDNHR